MITLDLKELKELSKKLINYYVKNNIMSRIIFYLMAILIAFTSLSCACAGDNMENCISGPIYNDSPMENCSFEANLDNVDTQDVASDESDINEENLSKETHFFSTIYDFGDNYDNNLTNLEV